MSDETTKGEPASFVTADEAKAALERCAHVDPANGPDQMWVHCWVAQTVIEDGKEVRRETRTDMHVEDAINMVDQAHHGFDDGDGIPPQLQCAYVDSKYGRCLHVFLGDGQLLKFESVVPE